MKLKSWLQLTVEFKQEVQAVKRTGKLKEKVLNL